MRALQTLALTLVLGLPSVIWIAHIAPNWIQELHSNLLTDSAPGGACDPGVSTPNSGSGPSVNISLPSNLALVWNNPHIYNTFTYLVCGVLLLVWVILILRSRFSWTDAWIALGSLVPLTVLVTYHRPYDAKLLLLAIPACAILWAEKGLTGWVAALLTTGAIVATADIPLTVLLLVNKSLGTHSAALVGKILAAVVMRPTPLILLGMSIFYLWVYVRRNPNPKTSEGQERSEKSASCALQSIQHPYIDFG